jgi:lysophospholipase L1-like esterase
MKVRVLPAAAGRDRAVTALLIGDSLTHASCYSEELLKLCAAEGPQLTLRGTHHVEGFSAANVHEGYGGWTFRAFVSKYEPNPEPGSYSQRSSPFVFLEDGQPTFDFPRYVREHCEGQPPDFVTVALGCNDTFGASEDHLEETIDQMFGCADQLLTGIRQAGPETAIGLFLLVPPAASQDNFGANYACGQTRWQCRRNQHRVVERMLATYGGREKENIFLIPAYVNLDTVHNFPTATGPANARSDFPITRGVNGVHPAPAGYYQMADTLYAWLKGRLSQR